MKKSDKLLEDCVLKILFYLFINLKAYKTILKA